MNRDVRILQKLAKHLSARPASGSGSDIDRLVVALLNTSEELHEEDRMEFLKKRAEDDAYSEACAADSHFNVDKD